jgi:Tfp pilus assembly protein PilN
MSNKLLKKISKKLDYLGREIFELGDRINEIENTLAEQVRDLEQEMSGIMDIQDLEEMMAKVLTEIKNELPD